MSVRLSSERVTPFRKPILSLLDRYVAREFMGPFFLCVAGFTVVLLSGVLFDLTDLIFVKRVPVSIVSRMLLYKVPHAVVFTLPIAALFATLLSLGRLAKDGEMTVIRGSGLPFARLTAPVLVMAIGVSLAQFALNEWVVPSANHRHENIVRSLLFKDPLPAIEQNVFFKGPDNQYFYIGQVDRVNRTLGRIMIYETGPDAFPTLVTASTGTYEGNVWHLGPGVTYRLDAEGHVTEEVGFESLRYPLHEQFEVFLGEQKTTDEMSRSELRAQIELLSRSGLNVAAFAVDYHLKLALGFAAFLFTLVGAPLAPQSARSGRFFGVLASVLIAFAYYVVTSVCRSLAVNGVLPPLLGAWAANLLFALAGLVLLVRADR